jgi:hypothetical protein
VEIKELALLPTGTSKQINGSNPRFRVGDVIVNKGGMSNGHGPQSRVGKVGPMDGCMQQHRTRKRHDGLNGAFSHAVVVMCAHSCKLDDLGEGSELGRKVGRRERCSVVRQV